MNTRTVNQISINSRFTRLDDQLISQKAETRKFDSEKVKAIDEYLRARNSYHWTGNLSILWQFVQK